MTIAVNGKLIRDEEIAAEMQYHPAPTLRGAVDAAARALVVRELLAQEAARLGLDSNDEAAFDRLLAAQVSVPDADDDTRRRYYRANQRRFRSPELYEASHILIGASPDDDVAMARAKASTEALIAALQREPDRFAELAAAHSDCPSKNAGGSLGQITQADVEPELATFLAALDAGQLCSVPVRTQHGWHVVRLDRRAPAAQLPYEAVRERIAAYLSETAWRNAVRQYIGLLAGEAQISGIDIGGRETPLVQ
jgi:peptidyl-prolyl cis-trans isomerase C